MEKISLKNLNMPGMRIVKTAIAVMLGLYISYLLGLDSPIFVSISSITTLERSYTETFESVRKRVVTAIIGVILGFVLSLITDDPMIRPLVAGLGIVMVIVILLHFKMQKMISLTCIVFIASYVAKSDKIVYGVNRVIGTVLGVVISLIVNFLISSPKIERNFNEVIDNTYEDMLRMTKQILLMQNHPSISNLRTEIESANKYYELMNEEVNHLHLPEEELNLQKQMVDELNEVYINLRIVNLMRNDYPNLTWTNRALIEDLFHFTVLLDGSMDGSKNIVYNYHINLLLTHLQNIEELYKGGSSA